MIRLLTDLLDVPAWVIGLLYRYRWQVELFFRWLKATAGFRHLLCERREAIAFEVYVAVIGTLLLAPAVGRPAEQVRVCPAAPSGRRGGDGGGDHPDPRGAGAAMRVGS